jgi:hypothetical protein
MKQRKTHRKTIDHQDHQFLFYHFHYLILILNWLEMHMLQRYSPLRKFACGICVIFTSFFGAYLPKVSGAALAFQHKSISMLMIADHRGRNSAMIYSPMCWSRSLLSVEPKTICKALFSHSKGGSQSSAQVFVKVAVTLGCLAGFYPQDLQARTVDQFPLVNQANVH